MTQNSKQDEPIPIKKETEHTAHTQDTKQKKSWYQFLNREWATTVIFSGTILLLLATLITQWELFSGLFGKLLDVLNPILIGLAIAFILYKPTVRIEQLYQRLIQKRFPRFPSNALAVLSIYLLVLICLALLMWIVVPQFVESILDFTDNILVYYNNVLKFLNTDDGERILNFLTENGFDPTSLRAKLTDLTTYIPTAVATISDWASSLVGGVANTLIGLIFSIYILAGKHKLVRQGSRILHHYLSDEHYKTLSHYGKLTFRTFSEFISGKIMDSIIIGFLVFVIMRIGGLEYPMMIAVVIGVTNVIPFAGPIIGAIPCILILLMVNPIHAVAFLIIILIVQQFDSNILTPYIVGNSIGLPAIWVLFAITVGGSLFGVLGMLLGTPVMSIIYTIFREKTASSAEDDGNVSSKKRGHFHPIRFVREKVKEKQKKK